MQAPSRLRAVLASCGLTILVTFGGTSAAAASDFGIAFLRPVGESGIRGKVALVDHGDTLKVVAVARRLDPNLAPEQDYRSVLYATNDCSPPPLLDENGNAVGIVDDTWRVGRFGRGFYKADYDADLDDVVTVSIRLEDPDGGFPPGTLVACGLIRRF